VDTGGKPIGTALNLLQLEWHRILRRAVNEIQPDLAHIISPHEWNPFVLHWLNRAGIPTVYTVHDPDIRKGTPFHFRLLETLARRLPAAWICLSALARRQLLAQGFPAERVFASRLGVFDFGLSGREPAATAEKLFLFFGRIEPYKGLEVLLQAAPAVFHQVPDWRLVVAGEGDLSAYRALLDHPNVTVVNRYLADEELSGWLQRAGILVLPYTEASQSAVITSAFAYGKPVIAADAGSIAEVLEPGVNGLLFPVQNVDALVQAMVSLAGDSSARTAMAHANRQAAQTRFSWDQIAAETVSIYAQVPRCT
jgi:glycosyltransferase involved in cell wall biosynthesis